MKVLQGIFLAVLTLVLSVASLLTASAFKWANELPDLSSLDALEYTITSQVYARDGRTLIGELVPTVGADRQSTDRLLVGLDQVSPAALMAIVAYEDDQFFNHYGFDIPALLRATYEEFVGGGDRGGSTITTQVVKNTVLKDIRDERTLERKAKELMLAVELERRYTKAEILQRYINVIFWGGNIYGIRAASQAYFDKEPIDLTLAEGLYLARLIPAPNARHDSFRETRQSMRIVLDKMVEQGMITEEAARRAWLEPIQPTGWSVSYDEEGNIVELVQTDDSLDLNASVNSTLSDHVIFAVKAKLLALLGEDVVFGEGGLKVYTTIDMQAQRAANEASRNAEIPPGAELALVGLDPATGEVLAMVGGYLGDGDTSEFNRATQAFRQPGSSFKPIVYATALELGAYTQATVIADEPTAFRQPGQEPWAPNNHDETFEGFQTLRRHLDTSRNIPAVKLAEAVTIDAVVARATQLGYVGCQAYLPVALGACVATPLQHASAIGAFANGGVHVEPYFISRVEDADGNVIYESSPRETRVWSEQTAYLMLDMMHGNASDPGAFSLRAGNVGRWVAGKTGTTNDERDIWFVGITPGMAAAVWMGYDDYRPLPETMEGAREGGDVSSSRQPIYVWNDFIQGALLGTATDKTFPVPESIVFESVDLKTGQPSPNGVRMAFVSGNEPSVNGQGTYHPIAISIPVDKRTNLRATETTPRDQIEWLEVTPEEIGKYMPELAQRDLTEPTLEETSETDPQSETNSTFDPSADPAVNPPFDQTEDGTLPGFDFAPQDPPPVAP